jgi:predicted CDP-diglyceride synthetase/phosphatidate cytidylyltransferase
MHILLNADPLKTVDCFVLVGIHSLLFLVVLGFELSLTVARQMLYSQLIALFGILGFNLISMVKRGFHLVYTYMKVVPFDNI